MSHTKKGFTLIELLIVIGILAILATTVVLVLNPARILQESRDVQRLSDLSSVQSAVGLYLATATTTLDTNFGATGVIRTYIGPTGATCGLGGACTQDNDRTVDGNGWVRIELFRAAGGSPLSSLPVDPTNDINYFYAYGGNDASVTYELNGRLESEKHRTKMETDGGDDNICTGAYQDLTCWYEIGTEPGLDL